MTVLTVLPNVHNTFPLRRTPLPDKGPTTHVLHLPVRRGALHRAAETVRQTAPIAVWLTGSLLGGDCWHEWAEPAGDSLTLALHVDLSCGIGQIPASRARLLTTLLAEHDLLHGEPILTGADWDRVL